MRIGMERTGFGGKEKRWKRAGLTLAAVLLLWVRGTGALAQEPYVFPQLLPAGSEAVLSVPDTVSAWQGLERAGVVALLEPKTGTPNATAPFWNEKELGFAFNWGMFFREVVSSFELAVYPPNPKGESGTARVLVVAQIKDLNRLRQIQKYFETKIRERAASPEIPVTRALESVGQAAVLVLSDARMSLALVLDVEKNVWAVSNDADLARDLARRLDGAKSGFRDGSVAGLEGVAAAWKAWRRTTREAKGSPMFLTLRGDTAAEGEKRTGLSALRNVRPTAIGVRFEEACVGFDAFSLYRGASDPGDALWRERGPAGTFTALAAGAPDALAQGGGNLFDSTRLRLALAAYLKDMGATLPAPSKSGLNAASSQMRTQIEGMLQQLSDPQLWAELGPEWGYGFNRFAFTKPGEFPSIDAVAAFRTRQPAVTQERMARFEALLTHWVKREPAAPANGAKGAGKQAATASGPSAFQDRPVDLGAGGKVTLRCLSAPGLPAGLTPSWCLYRDHLWLGLSPEGLQGALQRAAGTESPGGELLKNVRETIAVEGVQECQTVELGRAARPVGAVMQVVASDPSFRMLVPALIPTLEQVRKVSWSRSGGAEGIRTTGIVRLK
jgi:hypothetical protein